MQMSNFVPNELPVDHQGCAPTLTNTPVNHQPHFPAEITQISGNSQETFFEPAWTLFSSSTATQIACALMGVLLC